MKPVFFIFCIFFTLGHAQFDRNSFENLLFDSGEGNMSGYKKYYAIMGRYIIFHNEIVF